MAAAVPTPSFSRADLQAELDQAQADLDAAKENNDFEKGVAAAQRLGELRTKLAQLQDPAPLDVTAQLSKITLQNAPSGSPKGASYQTLPPLKADPSITKSPPSIPHQHDEASGKLGSFGFVVDAVASPWAFLWSMLSQREKQSFSWASESDIQYLVKETLQAVLKNVGLASSLQLHNELSVFEMRPDIWIVTSDGVPVGVVEVKKPDREKTESDKGILNHPRVFGQIYDYMMRLRSFFGLQHVFGILTTYAQWRVVWLDEPSTNTAAAVVGVAQVLPVRSDRQEYSKDTGQQQSHACGGEAELQDAADLTRHDKDIRKILCTSVYEASDENLYRLLGSVVVKMFRAPVNPVTLIDSNRPYLFLTEKEVNWTTVRFRHNFQLRHGALPSGDVLLLDDYRAGRDGRLWRACTKAGLQCMIKFAVDQSTKEHQDTVQHQESRLRTEAERWNKVIERLNLPKRMAAHCRALGGHLALVMPYAESVEHMAQEDFKQVAEHAVRVAAQAGLEHGDLVKRHVRELLVSPCKGHPEGARFGVLVDWTEAKDCDLFCASCPSRSVLKNQLFIIWGLLAYDDAVCICLGILRLLLAGLAVRQQANTVPWPSWKGTWLLTRRSLDRNQPRPIDQTCIQHLSRAVVAPRKSARLLIWWVWVRVPPMAALAQ